LDAGQADVTDRYVVVASELAFHLRRAQSKIKFEALFMIAGQENSGNPNSLVRGQSSFYGPNAGVEGPTCVSHRAVGSFFGKRQPRP
jgi:hypothetical protein